MPHSPLIINAADGLTAEDKTDIVKGLREVARAIEQGQGNRLALMQAIGTELLVLALKNGPNEADLPPEKIEGLIRIELGAIVDTIVRMHEGRIAEADVLNERLTRMFDPYLAWNEAINRAIEKKKAAGGEVVQPSPQQKFMFEKFQFRSTMNALINAGKKDPQPTVHRVNGDDVAEIHRLLNSPDEPTTH